MKKSTWIVLAVILLILIVIFYMYKRNKKFLAKTIDEAKTVSTKDITSGNMSPTTANKAA